MDRFDTENNGALAENEFVAGWTKLALEPNGEHLLKRIKTLADEKDEDDDDDE